MLRSLLRIYIYIYISIVTNEEGLSSFDLGHQADED